MENTKEKKIIHARVWDPSGSLFKSNRNERATCRTIHCSNKQNCGLYARGECAYLRAIGIQRCPYGSVHTETGYTKRAHKYSEWLRKKEDKHRDVLNALKSYTDKMTKVGDYVFLPYPHITMNESLPFLAHGGFLRTEICFLPWSSFTIDGIINMCEFVPYAAMGGPITSYQKEVVPKFITHLYEVFPDLWEQLCTRYERAKNVIRDISYIGRKALLKTLKPNVGTFKKNWKWDGKYLYTHSPDTHFLPIEKDSILEIKIKPADDATVIVTSDEQVDSQTKFLD